MAIASKKRETVYSEEELLGRAAWYYYHDGLTQNEIGERLGISRVKVSRILEKGRRLGLIEVRVNSPEEGCFALETALEQAFGLGEVRVIPALPGADPIDRISQCAAQFLMSRLQESDLLAVGWGEMVVRVLQRLTRKLSILDASVVSLTGGVSAYMEGIGDGAGNATIHLTPAPLVVSAPEVRDILSKEKSVQDIL
ncbi:MAG: MarR family transcriptional regulator, partial [Rhodospirillales bacterium]|nr:MarR family transcriptional regulator [Rhodospirillales bacterium]